MKKEERELIIDLLFNKYKENKDEKILDLIKKVEKINFSAERVIIQNSHIITNGDIINLENLYVKVLDLSNTHLEISNEKIKVR